MFRLLVNAIDCENLTWKGTTHKNAIVKNENIGDL